MSGLASTTEEPQQKRRKQQAGDNAFIDNDGRHALLLSAMKVVLNRFLVGESSSLASAKGDESESNDEDDDDDEASDDGGDAENEEYEDSSTSDTDVDESVRSENDKDEDDTIKSDASEGHTTTAIDVLLLKCLRATDRSLKALVDEEMDRVLEDKTLLSFDIDEYNRDFSLSLSLSAGLDKYPKSEAIFKKCLDFIDPEKVDLEDHFDSQAAERALRDDGLIKDIYKFDTSKGHRHIQDIWIVEYKCDQDVTHRVLNTLRSLLVHGAGFLYPESYNDSSGYNGFKELLGPQKFTQLKDRLWVVLCRAKCVERSYWKTHFEKPGYTDGDVEREDYFALSTNHGGQNFVLKVVCKANNYW